MGNVRTEQIKRTAKELIRRFPDKFSSDFEINKHIVAILIEGATIKIRNQVAGYITSYLAGQEIAEPPEEEGEQTAQEQGETEGEAQ